MIQCYVGSKVDLEEVDHCLDDCECTPQEDGSLICECPDITDWDRRLAYKSGNGCVVKPGDYYMGAITTKPLDEDHRCILKSVKIWVRCIEAMPNCFAWLNCKPWSVVEKKFWSQHRRLTMTLERAEIDFCEDLVDLVKWIDPCDCESDRVPLWRKNGAPAITTHVDTQSVIENDAEWCVETREFCFDRCDLEIEPGVEILWCRKWYEVTEIRDQGNPRKLTVARAFNK